MEDLARLIEGRLDEIDKARVVAHVRTCRECFETYQDSAIALGLWDAGAPDFDSREELIAAGREVLTRDPAFRDTGRAETSPVRRSWFRRPLRAAVVTAALVIVTGGGYWLSSMNRSDTSVLDAAVLAPVKAAVESYSARGFILLPGGEGGLENHSPVYRSGQVPIDDPLKASLATLYDEYRGGSPSPDAAYWLVAGHVATDQIDAARDYVTDARKRFPDDLRIAVLEGIVAYLDGDYDRAEKLLRDVVRTAPNDPGAHINLALVLSKLGKVTEAREILTRVRNLHADTPLATRADSVLIEIREY